MTSANYQTMACWLNPIKTKAELSDNDAISDDVAALAYIEQFGNETFQRADNAMKANKASR